jgi:AraC-like DNA-binding protein
MMADACVVTYKLTEPTELQRSLKTFRLKFVPLQPDHFEGTVTSIDFGAFKLEILHTSPALIIGRVETGRLGCLTMLEDVGHSKWDGRPLDPCDFATLGSNASLVGSFHDRLACVFVSANENEAEWIPASWRERIANQSSRAPVERATKAAHAQLVECVHSAEEMACATPNKICVSMRDSLMAAATNLFAPTNSKRSTNRRAERRQRVVRLVDEYLCANPARPVYTNDLCRAVGVSSSALHEAFHAVLDISTHRYLKLRRMSLVRAALLSPTEQWHSVKAAALSNGFWHLSQFAQDYRGIYGELPSATLARTKPCAFD